VIGLSRCSFCTTVLDSIKHLPPVASAWHNFRVSSDALCPCAGPGVNSLFVSQEYLGGSDGRNWPDRSVMKSLLGPGHADRRSC
jgi:hypothetical protein